MRRLAAVAFACAALAATAVPEDAEKPIHLRADNAEGDLKGRTILTGSVRMDQGTMRVEADTMIIEQDGAKVVRITAEGELARYQQQLRQGADLVKANARTIIYHTSDERIELKGDAFLTQEDNEFRGDFIVYDIRAGKVDATSATQSGVEMIWQPAATEN